MKIFVFRDIRQINELITCKNPVSHQQQQQSNFLEFTMIIYVIVIRLSGVCNHRSDDGYERKERKFALKDLARRRKLFDWLI